jgi:hypothetical protein
MASRAHHSEGQCWYTFAAAFAAMRPSKENLRVSMCHCLDCRRRTGSLFSIAASFERSAVTVVNGASKTFTRNSLTGKDVIFHFCSARGSTVFWQPERMPQLIGVAVGAFADPSVPPPEQSVFTTYKHGCLSLREKMPAFAIMRPRPDR